MSRSTLPVHPTLRHPLTGEPIRAIYVDKTGRTRWPMMGGDETAEEKAEAEKAAADAAAKKAADDAAAAEKAKSSKNAVDAQGNDLGYPKDTPVAEMSDKEQAAYWKNNSRKHEGRVKDLLGDRDPADIKKDLDELTELRKAKLTPAEKELEAAKEEGRKEGTTTERTKAAEAILRGALEAGGVKGDELEELVADYNLARAITDKGIDTSKIVAYAKRHASDKDTKTTRRDFGGGQRKDGDAARGSAGKAEAARRFKKDKAQA